MTSLDLTDRISATVESRREDAERLLAEIVRIPSVTGDELAVQNFIEGQMLLRDLDVDRWEATEAEMRPYTDHVGEQERYTGRPNLLGVRGGAGGGKSLLLNAHVDTVEPGSPKLWNHDPYSGKVAGDYLYGRGSCDMKGALVSFFVALDALGELGVTLRGDVKVSATVGEEDGGLGALSTVLRGHRADAAIVAEPTRLRLVPAQGGSVMFRLTITGRSAHAAVRDDGVSAFEKFLLLYDEIASLEVERNATLSHPLYDHLENKVPINIGVVRTGNWASTVPESLTAEVRAGLLPGEDLEGFKRLLESRLQTACEEDGWLLEHPPEMEYFGGQFAPSEVLPDAAVCDALKRSHRAATGEDAVVEGVSYGSDMRHFIHFGGMPCVMYGAGDISLAHAPDEHIHVPDILTAARTFACLMVEWCGMV